MYDTIVCYMRMTEELPDAAFDDGRSVTSRSGTVTRLWVKPGRNVYHPRVNFYRRASDNLLSVQFSVPRMLGLSSFANPTEIQAHYACDLVSSWLLDRFELACDVASWTLQRIDYAWNFEVSDVGAYLSVLQGLHLSGAKRHIYQREGVVFKHKSRWVKFYDKGRELGLKRERVLRYEVSNMKPAVKYLAARWFECERVVHEFLQAGRAIYTLSLYLQQLGLQRSEYVSDAALQQRVRSAFGPSSTTALGAYNIINEHGSQSVELGLLSRASYHLWRKRLHAEGFLTQVHADKALCGLSFPSQSLLKLNLPQNLEVFQPGSTYPPEKYREILGVPGGPDVPDLLQKLEAYYGA